MFHDQRMCGSILLYVAGLYQQVLQSESFLSMLREMISMWYALKLDSDIPYFKTFDYFLLQSFTSWKSRGKIWYGLFRQPLLCYTMDQYGLLHGPCNICSLACFLLNIKKIITEKSKSSGIADAYLNTFQKPHCAIKKVLRLMPVT